MSSNQITRDSTANNTFAGFKKPVNGFLVFRSCLLQEGRVPPKTNVSVYAAQEWHKLSPLEKNRYFRLADYKNSQGLQPRGPRRRARSKARSTPYSLKQGTQSEIRKSDFSTMYQNQITDYSQCAGPSNISSLPQQPIEDIVDNSSYIPYDEPSSSSSAQVFLPAPQPVRPLPSWVFSGDVWSQNVPYFGMELPLRTREPSPPPPPQFNEIQDPPGGVNIEMIDFESFSGSYPFPEVPCPEGLFEDIGEAWTFPY